MWDLSQREHELCRIDVHKHFGVMADTECTRVDNTNTDELEIFGDNASRIKTFSVLLDGVVTDFVICDYVNQVLLIVTQFQKIGTLVQVTKGSVRNLNGCVGVYEVKTISGLDSQDIQLSARFLANHINIVKPVLFGISLKDYQPKTLKAISKVLKEYI